MQYQRRIIASLLIICLLVSAVNRDKATVVSAKSNPKIRVRLRIGNQTVSGKTISIREGKSKNIKITVPMKKNYGKVFSAKILRTAILL